jgi:hypothetical protein
MVCVCWYGRPPGRHAGKLVHLEAIHKGKPPFWEFELMLDHSNFDESSRQTYHGNDGIDWCYTGQSRLLFVVNKLTR